MKLKILGVEYENSRRRGERDDVATDEEDSASTYHFGVIKGTKKKITREKREIRIAFKITKIVSLELLKQHYHSKVIRASRRAKSNARKTGKKLIERNRNEEIVDEVKIWLKNERKNPQHERKQIWTK